MRYIVKMIVFLLLVAMNGALAFADLEKVQKALNEVDFQRAFQESLSLAEQGNAHAKLLVGYFYSLGDPDSQDLENAASWYRRAAEQGLAEAQTELATAYFHGHGIPQNYEESKRWAEKAARQEWGDANYLLGSIYVRGLGVPQDSRRAMELFNKAAEQGNQPSHYALAVMYSERLEKSSDLVMAMVHALVVIGNEDNPLSRDTLDSLIHNQRDIVNDPNHFENMKKTLAPNSYDLLQRLKNISSPSQVARAKQLSAEMYKKFKLRSVLFFNANSEKDLLSVLKRALIRGRPNFLLKRVRPDFLK